jgi:hypothetical protein
MVFTSLSTRRIDGEWIEWAEHECGSSSLAHLATAEDTEEGDDVIAADPPYEQQETDEAAREAAQIGGSAGTDERDPAQRPVKEAGGGEAEGFEEAEQALIDHASHGDQQAAHAILHHQGDSEEANRRREDGEADEERSSESR